MSGKTALIVGIGSNISSATINGRQVEVRESDLEVIESTQTNVLDHISYVIENLYKADIDYDYEYISDFIEWMKTGWFNPKKIRIPPKPVISNLSKRIRSSLPRKKSSYHFYNCR